LEEVSMAGSNRKVADCRKFPSDRNCSLTISGTEEEVLEAARQHAIASHGHEDTPELRNQLRGMLEDEPARG
jgi:Protein of unknown function (DUF1059)